MAAPISIIVPTLNAADSLPATLAHLYPGIMEGLIKEVIFADGGSTDATAEIAEEWGAEFITCPEGRGNQLAHAIKNANGLWYFILHADTALSAGWVDTVQAHIATKKIAGYGRLSFDENGIPATIVSAWANFRSRTFGLPYGDQTLLISARLYKEIGGYDTIPLMEDVAIARKLGRRKTALNVTAITSADKYRKNGWLKQGSRNLVTLLKYLAGADPSALAKRYNI